MNLNIVQVAVPKPLYSLFDYTSCYKLDSTHIGCRVLVPFGKSELVGLILKVTDFSSFNVNKLKAIIKLIDHRPIFNRELLQMINFASQYYHYPIGMTISTALPKMLKQDVAAELPKQQIYKLKSKFDSIALKRAPKQLACLQLLAANGEMLSSELNAQGVARSILDRLEDKGIIESEWQTSKIVSKGTNKSNYILTSEQQQVVNNIKAKFNQFACHVIDGVTGSGKTIIYQELIQQAIDNGRQVLVLVPEINLTPQTISRFEKRFNTPVVVLHSMLPDKQRLINYLYTKDGSAKIIIGTRLATFTPLDNPGLFIIDEEHDSSFKQQDHLRFSARDLLIYRAKLNNCPIIIGSATLSLETWHQAKLAKYSLHSLPNRVSKFKPPKIQVLDIRHKKLTCGLSAQLLGRIADHLSRNQQVLIFINRRGFAPLFRCFSCDYVHHCNSCDIPMVMHLSKNHLRCHHCDKTSKIFTECPKCNSKEFKPLGAGTEKIEQFLQQHFANAKVARVDRDAVKNQKDLEQVLDKIATQQADIIVGTQMLAKGHHFPKLTMVGILDVDASLYSADFRALEKFGQLVTQIAGRAGRGELPGEVVLQTMHPENPSLQILIDKGYHALLEKISQSRIMVKLPPFVHQALFRAQSKFPARAEMFLVKLKSIAMAAQGRSLSVSVLGPVAAPVLKVNNQFRYQLLLQATGREELHQMLNIMVDGIAAMRDVGSGGLKWALDVDPMEVV